MNCLIIVIVWKIGRKGSMIDYLFEGIKVGNYDKKRLRINWEVNERVLK